MMLPVSADVRTGPPGEDLSRRLDAALRETERLSAHEDRRVRQMAGETIALAQEAGEVVPQARARLALAWVIFENEPDEAAQLIGEALEQATQAAHSGLVAYARCLLARLAVISGQTALLMKRAGEALAAAETAGVDEHIAHAHSLQSIAYILTGNYAQALLHLERAVGGLDPAWPPTLRAVLLADSGATMSEIGRPHDARTFLEEALRVAEQHQLRFSKIIAQLNLGTTLLQLGEGEAGEAVLRGSLQDVRRGGDLRWEAYLLATLGERAVQLNQVQAGREQLQRALELAQQQGDASLVTTSHLHLSRACTALGQAQEAQQHLLTALKVAEQAGQQSPAAQAHAQLAQLYETQQDFKRALRHFRLHHDLILKLRTEEAQRRAQLLSLERELELSRQAATIQLQLNAELEASNAQLRQANDHALRQSDKLARIAHLDALTKLANRRRFMQVLSRQYQGTRRHAGPFSIAVLDADHFKHVNDRFGHPAGDQVLRVLARLFVRLTRSGDVVARLGGEEFVILFQGLERAQACEVAERIREAVRGHRWAAVAPGLQVTISIGVAEATEAASKERLLALADERLYAAKQAGRNRVY